jgi:outer membrane lipoprotein-sorting protein
MNSVRKLCLAIVLLLVAGAGRAQAQPLDLGKVADMLDNLYRGDSSIARMRLRVVKPSRTNELEMTAWSRGDQRALVVIDAPARDKGVSTLRVDDNLWQYLPKVSRTIRVPASMMLAPWMGSDFTNDDLVRALSYRKDFAAQLVGPSTEPAGLIVRFDALDKGEEARVGLWKRIDVVVAEDGGLPRVAKYYDRKGALARTLTFDMVKELGGRRIPSRMSLVSVQHPERRSELIYEALDFATSVPESTFSLSRLSANR